MLKSRIEDEVTPVTYWIDMGLYSVQVVLFRQCAEDPAMPAGNSPHPASHAHRESLKNRHTLLVYAVRSLTDEEYLKAPLVMTIARKDMTGRGKQKTADHARSGLA